MSKRLTPEQRAELTLALNGLGVLTVQRMRSSDKFTWTQPEIAGTAGRMQPEIANALATITKLAPQALDDLEALEKANDGSIERSYREASKVAIDILWSEHPEIPYESPKQVLEWLKAKRDSLRVQLREKTAALQNEAIECGQALGLLAKEREEYAALRAQLEHSHKTTEDLVANNAALRAQLEHSRKVWIERGREMEVLEQKYSDLYSDCAALRARCEQLQRENEALVHGAEAGPTR